MHDDGWVVDCGRDGVVDVWSVRRLPFEPKGPMLELRTAIRAGLMKLLPGPTNPYVLTATYRSSVTTLVDVENVLLYNVGTGAFGRPLAIHVERRFEPPPSPPDTDEVPFMHHHRYLADAPDSPTPWLTGRPACTWRAVVPEGPGFLSSAARTWLAVQRGMEELTVLPGGQLLALDVTIAGPGATRRALVSAIKCVLDGVVAACHHHDGSDSIVLAERLAQATGVDHGAILPLLTVERPSVLGQRRLLHRFGGGVQWNPADDRLVTFDLRLVEAPEWRISGALSPASAQDPVLTP